MFKQLVLAHDLFVECAMFVQMSFSQVRQSHTRRRILQFAPVARLKSSCLGGLFFSKPAALCLLALQKAAR